MIHQEAYASDLSAFAVLDDLRARLKGHALYGRLTSPRNIAIFMKHHVWAVWDFMSLVKALQGHLTGITVPWRPVGDAEVRYLINDIVLGEESDLDRQGRRASHFEMYLAAMRGLQASTGRIERFVGLLEEGRTVGEALELVEAPQTSADFVRQTFRVIERGRIHEIASLFTFGREDIIPTMFLGMLDRLEGGEAIDLADLRYYLERHVEVDGDHHGPLARRMVELLCGGDPQRYREAVMVARTALEARLALWDGILAKCEAEGGDR